MVARVAALDGTVRTAAVAADHVAVIAPLAAIEHPVAANGSSLGQAAAPARDPAADGRAHVGPL